MSGIPITVGMWCQSQRGCWYRQERYVQESKHKSHPVRSFCRFPPGEDQPLLMLCCMKRRGPEDSLPRSQRDFHAPRALLLGLWELSCGLLRETDRFEPLPLPLPLPLPRPPLPCLPRPVTLAGNSGVRNWTLLDRLGPGLWAAPDGSLKGGVSLLGTLPLAAATTSVV